MSGSIRWRRDVSQFRVLYRHFLFRLMDVELLSRSARGDASELLGQFVALLIFGSVLLSIGAVTVGQGIQREWSAAAVWPVERFLISLTMVVVGVFALLNWEPVFPDRRDVLVLLPLPVRAHTLLAAKMAASASALGLVAVAWNSLAGLAWPMMLAQPGSGLAGAARYFAAYWATVLAASIFVFCGVLGVQGLAAQLPRRWYLRVSPVLQMGLFAALLGGLFFPSSSSTPPDWFLGLLNELSGSFTGREDAAVMAPLARRAVAGVCVAAFGAGVAFLLSYFRTLWSIVEEPDVAPGGRAGLGLPKFCGGAQQANALAQFVIRTMLRSRQARVVGAFYVGGGLAVAAVYLGGALQVMRSSLADLAVRVSAPMLVCSVVMLGALWLGTRTAFSLPVDLRANWVFRMVPSVGGSARMAGLRSAMLALCVLPVLVVTAVLLLWCWPWRPAIAHLLLLGLLGSLLVDVSLWSLRKIPFTCSYLPGRSKAHMVFWFGIIPAIVAIHQAVGLELRAIGSWAGLIALVAGISACAWVARRLAADRAAKTAEAEFEQVASDELTELGLE